MANKKSAEIVMPLKIGDFVEGNGVFAGVLYDENGENPKSLFVAMEDTTEEMNWNEAMTQDYGQYHLPTIRELEQIHLYKDAINAGLKKNGGEPLKRDWYWSSSEVSYGYAWQSDLNYSYGLGNYNKHHTSYVRPVLAL